MNRRVMLVILAVAAPVAGRAQIVNRVAFGVGASSASLEATTPAATATLSGITPFGTARIGGRVLSLEVSYRQGTLKPDSGTTGSQDLVEGRVLAVARPLSWLAVAAGPHARAYVVPGASERWIFIEARVRAEVPVVGELVRTHVEGWTTVSASTNVAGSSGSAHGGEAGITLRLRSSPVWLRLAYAIDRAQLNGGARRETLEDVALSVGFGQPWTPLAASRSQ